MMTVASMRETDARVKEGEAEIDAFFDSQMRIAGIKRSALIDVLVDNRNTQRSGGAARRRTGKLLLDGAGRRPLIGRPPLRAAGVRVPGGRERGSRARRRVPTC